MKKLFAKLAVVLLLTASVLSCLASCGGDFNGTIEVYIGVKGETPMNYTLHLTKFDASEGVYSILEYMERKLSVDFKRNGNYVESIGSLQPDDKSYVATFTTVQDDWKAQGSAGYDTLSYGSFNFKTTDKDIFDMTVADGAAYYFALIRER